MHATNLAPAELEDSKSFDLIWGFYGHQGGMTESLETAPWIFKFFETILKKLLITDESSQSLTVIWKMKDSWQWQNADSVFPWCIP